MGKISESVGAALGKELKGRKVPLNVLAGPEGVEIESRIRQQAPEILMGEYSACVFLVSAFAQLVLADSSSKKLVKTLLDAEDEYVPGYPPMSPVTDSFFTSWSFLDLAAGKDKETVVAALLDLAGHFEISAGMLQAFRHMSESRTDFYVHEGMDGSQVRLRPLLGGKEIVVHSGSGYQGNKGEIWYARVFPPLPHVPVSYSLSITTPYIITGHSEAEWIEYLTRSANALRMPKGSDKMHRFLKHGPDPTHWLEYILLAYKTHNNEAIFLAGLPDQPDTMPHGQSKKK